MNVKRGCNLQLNILISNFDLFKISRQWSIVTYLLALSPNWTVCSYFFNNKISLFWNYNSNVPPYFVRNGLKLYLFICAGPRENSMIYST
jgi:hypothetical protein